MSENPEPKVPEVRCFVRDRDDSKRRGLWVMTRPTGFRGAFFHGDYREIQPPSYTVEQLEFWSKQTDSRDGWRFHEITPDEAMAELDKGWPEAKAELQSIFSRHGIELARRAKEPQ